MHGERMEEWLMKTLTANVRRTHVPRDSSHQVTTVLSDGSGLTSSEQSNRRYGFAVLRRRRIIRPLVTFVETKLFTKLVQEYLSDDEYAALQQSLIVNPEAGDVIPGSGGVRKVRWGVAGRGKRGGIRVIYYLRLRQGEIWMLTLYAKNVAGDIPAHVLKKIKEEIDG